MPTNPVQPASLSRLEDRRRIPAGPRITRAGVIVAGMCILICLGFAVFSPACAHWFLLPVTGCALLLAQDVANWFTRKTDLMDPGGLVGLYGLHFFFLAPLLHVHWDFWNQNVVAPPDWRPWLGAMAGLNFLGLLVYQAVNGRRVPLARPLRRQWRLRERPFLLVCSGMLLVCLALQLVVYRNFGGLAGYMAAYDNRAAEGGFAGMGGIFVISESFPMLAFMLYAVVARKHAHLRRWGAILLAVAVFIVLKMLFGGFRGSRSNTIFGLFWVAGIIHFDFFPINRKLVAAGLAAVIGYMYFYGFYKAYGLDAFEIIRSTESRRERAWESGRSTQWLLLGDLGRSDVQGHLLYRLTDPESTYHLRWGETYLHWPTLLLPEAWRPALEGKREAGTEAQIGFISEDLLSSRIYGLAGEAMLNFGPWAVPPAFALLGWVVLITRRLIYQLPRHDPRRLMIPLLTILAVILPESDMNNVQFFLVKNAVIPVFLIWLCSQRRRRVPGAAGA